MIVNDRESASLINTALFDQMQKTLIGVNFGYLVHYSTLTLVEVGTPSDGDTSHCRLLYAPISL